MKTSRMTWMLLCTALALPVAAWAQHGQAPPAPHAPAPSVHDSHDDLALGGPDEWFAPDELPGGDLFMDEGGGGGDAPMMRHHRRAMRMHGERGQGMSMHRRFAKLDLTEQQRDKMREIHDAAERKSIQRNADLQVARLDLHKLMRADSPNAQAVNAQIDKMAKLRAEAMKSHYETYLQARALLTPEQLQKLKEPPAAGSGQKKMRQHGDASGGI